MFEKLKAKILIQKTLGRPDIGKAYAMVDPSDPWYDTISRVHASLEKIHTLPADAQELISHDGTSLLGVYYPGKGERGDGKVTVICVHGYTSHAEREWAFPGLFYLSLGYNVLIPYQRAHGASMGEYITFGALEHRDLMGWVELINQKIPNGRIILHGLSMGGSIVLDVCDKPLQNVCALIADAPSTSIKEFFFHVSRSAFKKEGDAVAAHALSIFKQKFGADAEDFEAAKLIQNCRYPLLLAAGSNEGRAEQFAELKRLNPQPTEIVILPGCDHGNGMYKQTETYQGAIKDFIARYI